MRSSSMKSIVAVTTLTAVLILAVPAADAKPLHQRSSAKPSTIASILQSISRFFGVQSTGLPGDPIPAAKPPAEPDTTDSNDAPKKEIKPRS